MKKHALIICLSLLLADCVCVTERPLEAAAIAKGFDPAVFGNIANNIASESWAAPGLEDARMAGWFADPARLHLDLPVLDDALMRDAGIDRSDWQGWNDTQGEEKALDMVLKASERLWREITPFHSSVTEMLNENADLRSRLSLVRREGGAGRDLIDRLGAAGIGDAATDYARAIMPILAALARDLASAPPEELKARRFETMFGTVRVGTSGPDYYDGHPFLIFDPGGDDTYNLSTPSPAQVMLIVDMGGNDSYRGDPVALLGLFAIIDMAGDDRVAAKGSGAAAALGGVALHYDHAGDDSYVCGGFGQGAAGLGVAALIDREGADSYRIGTHGQGFGWPGGFGLLWDMAGDDSYTAAGADDSFRRGGRLSFAQGSSAGFRTKLAGGIGLLRDEAGDDSYVAELYGQGVAYFGGAGLLADHAGDDTYTAIRYAQGIGVHRSIGALVDMQGNDSHALEIGVGQGTGLDNALGFLIDADGENDFTADWLAQGAGTACGLGVLDLRFGTARLTVRQRGGGYDHISRGLLSPSFLLGQNSEGPITKPVEEKVKEPDCSVPLTDLTDAARLLDDLDPFNFGAVKAMSDAGVCALRADPALSALLVKVVSARLTHDAADRTLPAYLSWILALDLPESEKKALADLLWAHPSCSARIVALVLDPTPDRQIMLWK
ncbi:MAG: hypothetical protein U9N14_02035 [Pseudomonadota bacterium]|nr:hypothetical protein [Pseudomonadota bacterium]